MLGNYAYLMNVYSGLQVVDVSDKANPIAVGSFETRPSAIDLDVSGEYVYLAGSFVGMPDSITRLHIVDVSNKTIPVIMGSMKEELSVCRY